MSTSVDWNDVPDIALIYIYSHLSDIDRLNVALTCKNWSRLFPTATLWRQRRVAFNAGCAESTSEKEIKFLDKFGHCLNKLTLNFGRPTFQSCMAISKAVENYLNRISKRNDIQIRELDLECLHMEQHWHFILSRNRLVSALCRMIRKQHYLVHIYLAGARMRLTDGCRVLEALTRGRTRGSIKSLYMEDFFETNLFPARNNRFTNAMLKFLALGEIHINYRYISSEILRNIANKLHKTIEHLSLVLEGDVRGTEIPADAWMEFSERCPLAEVEVYLCTTILRGNDLRSPFVRGMPLTQLYLTSWARTDDAEQRLSVLLRHLGNVYNTSLENFSMFFDHHQEIDVDLLYMLRKCRKIKDLCVQARISADTVLAILRLQNQGKLSLRSINLTVPGLSAEDWNRIDAQKERLLSTVTEFAHIGPNDIGSSNGSSTITDDDVGDEVDINNNDGIGNVIVNIHPHHFDEDGNEVIQPQANGEDEDDGENVQIHLDDEGFLM